MRINLWLMCMVFGSSQMYAQGPVALGAEFQVDNVSSPNSRNLPGIAKGAAGGFLAVWYQEVNITNQGIYGRLLLDDGTPSGSSFRIDSATSTTMRIFPAVAALSNGNYIVAWEELSFQTGTDNSGTSVRAKIIGGSGAEFQVNTFTDLHQGRPTVAGLPNGGFVVAWQSDGSNGNDHSATSIQAQRFDANGSRVGSEFQVNTYTSGDQMLPSIAAGSEEFVVAWQSSMSDGDSSGSSIRARRFDINGQPIGNDFQVNVFTVGAQRAEDLVVGPDNGFVIVWTSGDQNLTGPDGSDSSIQGRRYDSFGTPIGGEFQINTQFVADQADPAIALRRDGGFIVIWFDRIEAGDSGFLPGGIRGQVFNADGSRQGAEFPLNTYIPNAQDTPDVAVGPSDSFVAIWRSVDQNGDGSGDIIGRRFSAANSIFADGFESGNLSSWN